jgi:hypothetical protein
LYKVSCAKHLKNDKSVRGNHTAMDHFIQKNTYRVQNFLRYISKLTATPNIRDRTKGSLVIIENNVAVSYCGLGEIFQHHKGGTERKRKKI